MKIVVGLGNPGSRYDGTRHNVGFLFVDRFARHLGILTNQRQCDALTGQGKCDDTSLLLAKPQTYMNRSGVAVAALLLAHGATAADLVVVYDDLDLPLGRIRVRASGSAGGHRGMSSIIDHMGPMRFSRIRIGIGRPPEGVAVIDYVLARFNDDEIGAVSRAVDRSVEALDSLVRHGAATAMAVYNRAEC